MVRGLDVASIATSSDRRRPSSRFRQAQENSKQSAAGGVVRANFDQCGWQEAGSRGGGSRESGDESRQDFISPCTSTVGRTRG
jgi:hypothetical protein